MDINTCIERTKMTAFDALISTARMMAKNEVPDKIILDAALELFVNMIAIVNNQTVTQIFETMNDAEVYLKAYCDDFRSKNGMLNDEEDEDEDDNEDEEEDE